MAVSVSEGTVDLRCAYSLEEESVFGDLIGEVVDAQWAEVPSM